MYMLGGKSMPIERNSRHGNINITMEAIAEIAGNHVLSAMV